MELDLSTLAEELRDIKPDSSSRRGAVSVIKRFAKDIESAMARGVTREQIVSFLSKKGITTTPATLSQTLSRIRKARNENTEGEHA